MPEDDLSLVYVDEKTEREQIQYEDVGFLYIGDEQKHVWLDGTHYIGVGAADTVNVGDLFFMPMLENMVHKVISIDESVPTSDAGVEVEAIYGPLLDWDDSRYEHASIDQLTGNLRDPPMGYAGPPTLLKEVTAYEHEGGNQN